jgi:murein DD-endopeptidase MepM/ murein hydrolase activator NlpD
MNSQPFIEVLNRHTQDFSPVVAFDPTKERLLLFDFTEANKEITSQILDDTKNFTDYINQKLKSAGAKFGIGGYNERREVYSRSKVFNEAGKEPRRLHLGIDIWGKPYTAVMSPLDGVVHSFAFNNNFGDYGATLILTHNLDGVSFHSLYGHLSLNSIKNLREGGNVREGDVIAEFGIPFENGQWPPHLHFQIIIDMEDRKGDYPGVCAESEKGKYLANCPDPDLVLQMMKFASS